MEEPKYRIKEYRGVFTVEVEVTITTPRWFKPDLVETNWIGLDKNGSPAYVLYMGDRVLPYLYDVHICISLEEAKAFLERITEEPKYHYLHRETPPAKGFYFEPITVLTEVKPTDDDLVNAVMAQVNLITKTQ